MPHREATLDSFRDRVRELSEQFARHAARYRGPAYNEETARSEFISPFFEALGWDVANRQGHAPQYREVVHEEGVKVGDATKAPDYTFRIGGQRKFFVEAKKPGVDLKHDPAPAYQLRRYAWSAKLPLSLLTDFDELGVYDTRIKPTEGEKAAVARVFYFEHSEYVSRAEEIWTVFSKPAVLKGSFDAYAEDNKRKRGTSEVDGEFLKEIEGWREELAKNIALRNSDVSVDELNYAVQATIDRILFLRIAEGRGAEVYGRLLGLANGAGAYGRMMELFRQADERYNSGVFDFKADKLTPGLAIDDKVLKPILQALYYPQSPYEFSVLPAEILGNVYEQFLGKVIRLTPSGRAKVEEKPEVKKAGGVYYTPSYIVDYIVAHTVGKLVEGKSPKEMAKLKIVDPACGSGSFLLAAYQKLLDAHLAWYREHEPRKHKEAVFEGPGGDWRLTTAKKREVLLDSIHGVDIDRQAVEVTKLSLLLKCLEGETNETLRQLNLYGERALPSLEKNIQCGNSLISPQALLAHTGGLFPPDEEMRRINPFDWHKSFPEVFNSGGFDVVVGNPPYIRIQVMQEWAAREVDLYKNLYGSATAGNYDVYVVFIERALSLLRVGGLQGFIVPHKFFNAEYGAPLRALLSDGKHVQHVVHLGHQQVFEGATTYTCLLFLSRNASSRIELERVDDLASWRRFGSGSKGTLPSGSLDRGAWAFALGAEASLLERLKKAERSLAFHADRIFQGLKTGADKVYIVDELRREQHRSLVYSKATDSEHWLESELLHPLVKGGEIKRYFLADTTRRIIFPYRQGERGRALLIPWNSMRSDYPLIAEYFDTNRRLLEERDRGRMKGPQWWAYSRSQALDVVCLPKILTPDIAARPEFCLDAKGRAFFTGGVAGGYGILLREASQVLQVLGILNSNLFGWFIKKTSTTMRGGYCSFESRFIQHAPIRLAEEPSAVGQLAARLMESEARLRAVRSPSDKSRLRREVEQATCEIDRLVYELYELTAEEIAIVEKG